MGFQVSPGINVTEIDLTTIIPAVATTTGAIAGPFRWGPANVPMLIDSQNSGQNSLVSVFGEPDNTTANTWFCAANFLAYANALQTVRIVKTATDIYGSKHLNATSDGSGLLIMNETIYNADYANGQGNVGMFTAKYAGDLGNTIAVAMADAASFGAWQYKTSFQSAPNTSTVVSNAGGLNDEMHVCTVDVTGVWTGTPGTILETFPFVSKCAIATNEDGTSSYYPQVINAQSRFVWWMGHPTEEQLGIDIAVNWGSSDPSLSFQQLATTLTVTSVTGTFTAGEVVADATGATVSSGSGAVLGTPVVGAGGIATIPVSSGGTGYLVPPTVTITGDGNGAARAVAVLSGTSVASITVTVPGANYTSATATLSSGSGASATVTVGGGIITGFTSLVGGSGYTSVPTVVISGDGAGATAHAVLTSGVVTSLVVDNPGTSTYTTATAAITAVGSGATAGTITFNTGTVLSIPVSSGGSGYVATPTVSITGGGGTSATATATVTSGVVTSITVTAGGSGYNNTLTQPGAAPTATVVPLGSGATAVVTVDGTGRVIALTPTAVGSGYTAATVVISGPGVGASVTPVISSGQITSYTVNSGGSGYSTISGTVISYAFSQLVIAPISGIFTDSMSVQGLTSGAIATVSDVEGGAIYSALTGGVDSNAFLQDADYMNTAWGAPAGYSLFQNTEAIDISLVISGAADQELGIFLINDLCEERLDCVCFLSPPMAAVVNNAGNEAVDIVAWAQGLPNSSYAILDSGWKWQYDPYNDLYRWVPLNGDIAGLCAYTDEIANPWWSPAGYNRGLIKNVVKLAWNPEKAFRDILYPAGINPVITDPGYGTLLFGDKTYLLKPSAFDRINVRRLFIVLEKAIATAAKFTLFEFNDQFTQAQFVNMVDPFLRQVQGGRGIYDFLVVCNSTNNTPQVIDANQFVGDIYIKPARSINFIQLNFIAVPTGVDFTEIVGGS